MHFTETEIRELEQRFGDSLRKGLGQLGDDAPTLSEIQEWMIKNNVDRPDVLELILGKIGPGYKASEKKMS